MPTVPSLADVLRSTLRRLEHNEELAPNDPRLIELRRSLLRTIAEIESRRSDKHDSSAA
ncbi:MAG TPA: hypothetical protein VMD25_02180 [Acidobacteriaceae bacterium]|nr:hypothetical protein [Acidobacteriaceae bacterium]